jgi:DNA polymerase-3 subunit delta'
MTLYPWQAPQWASVQWSLEQSRLAHALLISGPEGMGKSHFAQALVTSLLCQNRGENQLACGACRSCLLYQSSNHPDFIQIAPEESGKQIGIDAVRALGAFVALKPQQSAHKCILVEEAHMMNSNSANAFLKTLEEPNDNTYLILVTSQPSKLLATIRSRCQVIQFIPEISEAAELWVTNELKELNIVNYDAAQLLNMSGGAPLQALKYAQNGTQLQIDALAKSLCDLAQNRASASQLADKWLKISRESDFFILDWYYRIIHSQLLIDISGKESKSFIVSSEVVALIAKIPQLDLFRFMDEIEKARKAWSSQVNQQLLLEGLFLRWQNL